MSAANNQEIQKGQRTQFNIVWHLSQLFDRKKIINWLAFWSSIHCMRGLSPERRPQSCMDVPNSSSGLFARRREVFVLWKIVISWPSWECHVPFRSLSGLGNCTEFKPKSQQESTTSTSLFTVHSQKDEQTKLNNEIYQQIHFETMLMLSKHILVTGITNKLHDSFPDNFLLPRRTFFQFKFVACVEIRRNLFVPRRVPVSAFKLRDNYRDHFVLILQNNAKIRLFTMYK